jgi:hypothetical protein
VFELASVVDMIPPVPDTYKGRISWVKVGGLRGRCQHSVPFDDLPAPGLIPCMLQRGLLCCSPRVPRDTAGICCATGCCLRVMFAENFKRTSAPLRTMC